MQAWDHLQAGQWELAAAVLGRLSGQAPAVRNASAVLALRQNRASDALQLLRPLVFPGDSVMMDEKADPAWKVNFCLALLLDGNRDGFMAHVPELTPADDPAVRVLTGLLAGWQEAVVKKPVYARLAGQAPPLSLPPGAPLGWPEAAIRMDMSPTAQAESGAESPALTSPGGAPASREVSPRARDANRIIRVFISSTFRDMHAERDHLVTVVFPELRERVEQLGFEFFDVDLRWGVPEKGADGERANSWEYCRQWIERVEPLFVCMLGQRYGWVPGINDFRDETDRARQAAKARSITDLEVRHAVLDGRRKRRSYFYFRKTAVPPLPPGATEGQRAIYCEFVDPENLQRKLSALKSEIRGGGPLTRLFAAGSGRPVRDYTCRWTGEGFADLASFGRLVLEDLWSGILRDERYVDKAVWRQVLGADPDADPRYADETRPVPRELWEKIVLQARPQPLSPSEAERRQADDFVFSRLRWFRGRTRELRLLADFIASTDEGAPRLAVVAAMPGQGKSALLAKLYTTLVAQPPAILIGHFVGAGPGSADLRELLRRLCRELYEQGGFERLKRDELAALGHKPGLSEEQAKKNREIVEKAYEIRQDVRELPDQVRLFLAKVPPEKRVVILIDGVNQLDAGHDLNWLPASLGANVRVVVSCIDESGGRAARNLPEPGGPAGLPADPGPAQRVLRALASRQPAPLRVPLGELEPDDVRVIVSEYLREYCKELDPPHENALCAMPQARNPLYLTVMLGELRALGGNDMNRLVGERIAALPRDYPDTESLFRWVLGRLEVFGRDAVGWWCLYLAHGREGMASHELADLLVRKFGAGAAATALLIERGLRRYLHRRGPRLDFFHAQLREAVLARYGGLASSVGVHSDMADYFLTLADPQGLPRWRGGSPRPFRQALYHLGDARRLDDLCGALCDLLFIQAACSLGLTHVLVGHYALALEALPEFSEERARIRRRDEAMRRYNLALREYAAKRWQWHDRGRQGPSEPVPVLPREIEEAAVPQPDSPRAGRLRHFANFVSVHLAPLAARPQDTLPLAFNWCEGSPVSEAAAQSMDCRSRPWLRRFPRPPAPSARPQCLRLLEGHGSHIASVSLTPDGRRVVSACPNDNTLRLWDSETGECLRVINGPNGYVQCVCAVPDGRRAVSGNLEAGGSRFRYTLRIWDLDSGACLRTLEGHDNDIRDLAVTPDCRWIVSGGEDKSIRVWDLETGECLRVLEGHGDQISCISLSPDGRRAVSSGKDQTARLWDLASGKSLHTLVGHRDWVWRACFTPDGRHIVSAGSSGTLRVWDAETGEVERTLEAPGGSSFCLCVTPDGRRVITGGGDDKRLRVRDLQSGDCVRLLAGHSENVSQVCVTPDGRRAISGADDHTIWVWDLEADPPQEADGEGHGSMVSGISDCVDGKHVISSGWDGFLRLWQVETGRELGGFDARERFVMDSGFIECIAVTRDGRRLVSGATNGKVRVWDLQSGTCLHSIDGHKGWDTCTRFVCCVSLSPDGRQAVTGGSDETLRLWDIEAGTCLRVLSKPDMTNRVYMGRLSWIRGVSVCHDGVRVVSGGEDKRLRVWDMRTGECLRVLEGHKDSVHAVSTTRDGRKVVSASADKTLRVWDLASGACLRVLEGHGMTVTCVGTSPEGGRAVSGSADKTLRVWDLETGDCLAVYYANDPIRAVAWAAGADCLVCGTERLGQMHFLAPVKFPPPPICPR